MPHDKKKNKVPNPPVGSIEAGVVHEAWAKAGFDPSKAPVVDEPTEAEIAAEVKPPKTAKPEKAPKKGSDG